MFEFIFLLVFLGMLLFTGISFIAVFGAIAISFLVMFMAGMVGFVFKLLPWLIVIGLGVWFYKSQSGSHRRYR
ncbi:envelope stress response protein PspG [Vibrio hannami]|uniref:envelope stress response protein PspG n=1 Tax=Vibrio hannami TaxID=2717094 RepID=UPI00240EA5E5|nr:envelope stress response protein PspG [Vibrio hannami]MDG3084732.1 envelope stress response protein PspG [Vibrio hannami]